MTIALNIFDVSDGSDISDISDISDTALTQRLQHKLDQKTKPQGSLGRLEALALQLGQILGTDAPQLDQPQMLVCAGDHGLAARGVSAYPSDVTWQMVENFLAGGAAVSVLAREMGLALTVVDCGVRHDFAPRCTEEGRVAGQPQLLIHKIALGTADSSAQAAMTDAQCLQAMANGRAIVKTLPGNTVLLGEMGIGNTSSASLLLARLAGLDVAACTGAGTGLDPAGVQRKVGILREVLAQHAQASTPLQALAAFGGFEIATLVGALLQAALERRVIVIDGFIVTSALLVAQALQPTVMQRCVFAHRSGEPGHALMLAHLATTSEQTRGVAVQPLLDLGLRLGEGSGAALAWPLLKAACRVMADMASFEQAGVSEKSA